MSDLDLTTVIEDAISDSVNPEPAEVETSSVEEAPVIETPVTEVSAEASVEAPAETQEETSGEGEGEASPVEVASPAARQQPQEAAVIDKKLGIAPSTNGRENRLPYSRVKKIVERAEMEASKPHLAKIAELEAKIPQYEQQLQNVAQFEHIMVNEPPKFMEMLAQIPAYQGFFNAVRELQEKVTAQATTQEQVVEDDAMPQPDEAQPDGSFVYSMDGLKKLMDWQARQVEAKVAARYKPLEEQWQHQQREMERQEHLNRIIPQIQSQIDEARTWALFSENEAEITQVLQQYPQASLESAYRMVVMPKLQANRDQMRAAILQEIQRAPRATSAPVTPSRPAPVQHTGPRSLEDVIREQLKESVGR